MISTSVLLISACLRTCSAQPAPRDATPQWVTPAVQALRVQHRTFDSQAAQATVSYHIYTPELYDTDPDRRFPVLYWLHGAGPGVRGVPALVAYFDGAIRTGKIRPMLIVFPNGLGVFADRVGISLWVDSKDGSVPMETVVVKELVPHTDATFRTIASREGRLVEGFSMGGYGAARLGLKYHDVFAAWSSLSGGPLQQDFTHTPRMGHPAREWVFQNVFGGAHEYYRAVSPWVLAAENAAAMRDNTPIRVVIGERDEMLDITREFDARLTSLEIPHAFTLLPGVGHSTMPVLNALGEANWEFYRGVFGAEGSHDG